MMVAIALWHREGMSSSFGVSVRCRTFVVRDEMGLLSGCGLGSEGVGDVRRLCYGVLCNFRLAELRSFVRRLSCPLSTLVRGVFILLGSVWVYGCAIGQMVWASSWYAFSIVMTRFAALSMWVAMALVEVVISAIYWEALRWASCVVALPNL
jgi:hypothetical protein